MPLTQTVPNSPLPSPQEDFTTASPCRLSYRLVPTIRQRILDYLKTVPGACHYLTIAQALELHQDLRDVLRPMVKQNLIERCGRGMYRIPPSSRNGHSLVLFATALLLAALREVVT